MEIDKTTKIWIAVAVVVLIVLVGSYAISYTDKGVSGNVVAVSAPEDPGVPETVIETQPAEEIAPVEEASIIVGYMGPLTGDAAAYGQSIKRGVELALKDSGLNIEVIYEDSKCDAKEAVTAVNKLISVDGVSAIVGEVCSGATLAAAPIAEENGVVMISASSTSPAITESGDYIFRTVPSDALQGSFGADLAKDRGFTKLAILYGNEDYGVGFAQVLEENFEGEVVASESFEKGSSDVRTQLAKIKDSGADVIYLISNSPDSAIAALKQIEELGIEATVIGSEGLKSQDIVDAAGEASEGMIVTSVSSGTKAFATLHEAMYSEPAGPFAAQAYDAMSAITIAIKNGATTSEQIKEALYGLEFDGVSGTIQFDSNGDVLGNYNVEVVENGEFISA